MRFFSYVRLGVLYYCLMRLTFSSRNAQSMTSRETDWSQSFCVRLSILKACCS